MKLKLWAILSIVILTAFGACKFADEEPIDSTSYSKGVFVICEGNFQRGVGTITFYNRESKIVIQDIYGKANAGAGVGDVLQDLKIYNDTAYMVVNGKNKIIVADAKTFKFVDSIGGFNLPRYFYRPNNITGYVSEWGANGLVGSVKEIDLKSKTVTKTLKTGVGADKLFVVGDRIYVLNNNGFGVDSTMAYFTVGDTIVNKIKVSESPNSIVRDINQDAWVLCGDPWTAKVGKLMKFRGINFEREFILPKNAQHLTIDITGNTLFFAVDNEIWTKDLLNFGATPPSVFMTKAQLGTQTIYGMGIDPTSGYLFVADALDSNQNGKVLIVDTKTKTVKESFTTGILPNGFYFK